MFYVFEWTPQGLRATMGDTSLVHLTGAWLTSGKRGFIRFVAS